MKVATVGNVVRSYRKSSGVSQKDLAQMVGISRATLNYLESGRDIEIGAGKLLALLAVLGIPFAIPGDVDPAADSAVVDRTAKAITGKGRKKLHGKVVVEALSSGRVPIGFEWQMTQYLETVPEPIALASVRAASASSGLAAQVIWRNGRTLAKAVNCTREVWLHPD